MSKIFISHSSHDNAKALAVAQWLEETGWGTAFLDIAPKQGLAPGKRWREALTAAAGRCEAVICLLSPAWLNSGECRGECSFACYLGKALIGVIIDPAVEIKDVPDELRSWQICNLVKGEERRLFTVQHDPLVPPTQVDFPQAGLILLQQGLQASSLNPFEFPWPPPNDPDRVPYRGLKALEVDDAAIFFARDAEIVACLDHIRKLRQSGGSTLLVLLGASGSGKSSFLRAGLWPRLRRNDRDFLPLPVIRPERAVLHGESGLAHSLSRAFAEYNTKKNLAEIRTGLADPAGFQNLLTELQRNAFKGLPTDSKPPTIILPLDQGEELFTADGRTEAEILFGYLGQSLAPEIKQGTGPETTRPHIIVIIAIRSDSYEPLQIHPALRQATREQLDLLPIIRDDYKEVILKPAERATKAGRKLTVDPDLVRALREEAEGADALPLIAYTLERLFVEHGSDGDLRLDEYQTFGGVKRALDSAITSALRNPSHDPKIPDQQAEQHRCLRAAFIPWLARIDPETETRKRRVARLRDIPEESHTLITRLINARLLTSSSGMVDGTQVTLVEVAHEALLRQWPTLSKWLDEDADQLKTAETVRRDAAEWDKKGCGEEWLDLRGDRLKAAEDLRQRPDLWALLTQQGQDYISKCREKEDRGWAEREMQLKKTAKMQKKIVWLLAIVAIVLSAGFLAVLTQTRDIGQKISLVLATQSKIAGDEGRHDRGLRFAVLAAHDTMLAPASREAESQLARSAHASTLVSQFTHQARVISATFSPDGTRLITESADNTARILDATTGKELVRFPHQGAVIPAAFNADGTKVFTTSKDNTVRIWDAATGKELAHFAHNEPVRSAAVTTDGTKLVTASNDNIARIWDIATGKGLTLFSLKRFTGQALYTDKVTTRLSTPRQILDAYLNMDKEQTHLPQLISVAFNGYGTKIVTASEDKTARVWDITTGKESVRLSHQGAVTSAAFSTDGTKIFTASVDKTVRIWDIVTGKELARFPHQATVISVGFNADGTKVVTASLDKTVRVWDAVAGEELTHLPHESLVFATTINSAGTRLVTLSYDGICRIWDTTTRNDLAHFIHMDARNSVTFSPDGTKIITASPGEPPRISPDGSGVLMSSRFGKLVRIWDIATGKELTRFTHQDAIWSVAFNPDGSKIATVSKDMTARVWDAASGKELARFIHENAINSIAFNANSSKALTTSLDNTARVWDVATSKEVSSLTHDDRIKSAIFNTDSTRVITVSDDKTVRIWDTASGKELARFSHGERIHEVAFNAHNTKMLIVSDDDTTESMPDGTITTHVSSSRTARAWNLTTGKELAYFTHEAPIDSVALNADGTRAITASGEKAVLWDTDTGKELNRLSTGSSISSVAFSNDGKKAVTASLSVQVWDVAMGTRLASFQDKGFFHSAAFTADGTKIISISSKGTARVWDVHWLTQYGRKELIERACREKLIGARHLTDKDIEIIPILSGREGEDICDPPSWFSHLFKSFGFGSKPVGNSSS